MIKQFLRDIDKKSLKNIISIAKNIFLLLVSLIINIKSTYLSSYNKYVIFKLIVILLIFHKSAYLNYNNYFSSFFILYLYLAGTKIKVIPLFNYLKLFVLYNILQKKLKTINFLNMTWIR